MLGNPSMLDGKETDFLFCCSSGLCTAIAVSLAFSFPHFLFNAFSNINSFLY